MKKLFSHPTFLHLIFYSLLLYLTPFMLLRNFLPQFISDLSGTRIFQNSLNLPLIIVVFIIFAIAAIIFWRKKLTLFRLFSLLILAIIWLAAQSVTDHYMYMKILDVQNNWHYIAYGLFAILFYRFKILKTSNHSMIIVQGFLLALFISVSDEIFQLFISNRVFDVSDIAKDLLGVLLGFYVLHFIWFEGMIFKEHPKIYVSGLKHFFNTPFPVYVFLFISSFIFLYISSLLTQYIYLFQAIKISLIAIAILFLIFNLLPYKAIRKTFMIIVSAIIIVGVLLFFLNHKKSFTHVEKSKMVYRGIPVWYFDLMIKPNGMLKLVDKKKHFYPYDLNRIFHYKADILILGSGYRGDAATGLPENEIVQFVYNPVTKQAMQIIKLKTQEAALEFNRLRQEGYNVMFIGHNE